jgi:hypothetical protein
MGNWLDRTALTVGLAFVAGIAAAVIVFVIVLKATGGNDNNNSAAKPTATTSTSTPATMTPAATAGATTTPSRGPTATPGTYASPDDALAGFVQGQLQTTYLGPCTQQAGQGVCSTELPGRSDVLAAFFVGPPLSKALGEAVITKGTDGKWVVEFLLAPQGGGALSVGIQAVVYGAGDCLNFHEEPRVAGKTLSCQGDGAKARIVSGPVEADSITWWQLDGLGWGSAEFLVPAAQ